MNQIYRKLIFCFLVIFLGGCKKNDVNIGDIFRSLQLSDNNAIADGTQRIGIVCEINPNATEDNLEFVLKTNVGVFTENKDTTLKKKPEFKNGKLVIETFAQVPLSSGTMIISVEPNQPLGKPDFIIKDSVIVAKSVPASLKLGSSLLGIGSNYQSEVQLTGVLFNVNGGKVSLKNKVVFEDVLPGNIPANGRYRDIASSSNSESKVSTYYGAGNLPVGTDILLRCILLDENGLKTSIKDSVFIRVNF